MQVAPKSAREAAAATEFTLSQPWNGTRPGALIIETPVKSIVAGAFVFAFR